MARFHKPVLLKKAVELLNVRAGKTYVDATVGHGGHALAILKLKGQLLGIDCDPRALKVARERLSQACPAGNQTAPGSASWHLARGNFVDIGQIVRSQGIKKVAGVIFDLGVSSYQLDSDSRGFSFKSEAPLDMRMDPSLEVTAKDLVNGLSRKELYELFTKLGQEKYSRRISSAILVARRVKKIETGRELAAIISRAVRSAHRRERTRVHPATRVFQALRIAVNDELNSLKKALPQALDLLEKNGRLVVISFHSGEDRVVKRFFKEKEENYLKIINKKPLVPSREEVDKNHRARSAKLRAAEKI